MLDWSSENGTKLLSSLVLPESAQLYAIAREIKMRQSWKPILDTVYGSSSALLIYGVCCYLNERANMLSKPRSIRFTMYAIVAAFFTTSYFMLKDLSTLKIEKTVDEELVNTDPIFIEGGREFYSKIIERNLTLREILEERGRRLYTALGNENSLLRTKHIPIVQRKSLFEKLLNEQAA